jgi:hypothetical protein
LVLGYPPPYYLRLRIYARQIDYFYRHLRELDPVYVTCPARCLAPEADRKKGCPDCEYTIRYQRFKGNYHKLVAKEIKRDLIEFNGVDPKEAEAIAKDRVSAVWTFESMAEDYRAFSELEALAGTETGDRPGGHDPNWNVRTKTAIGIIREERYFVRREVAHRREQERLAKARAEGKNV